VTKPKSSDLLITGDAYLADSELVLTTRTNQRGEALYKSGICAKEYKISMDVYVGDSSSSNHGAGLAWYELFEDTGNWGSVLEFNIADYARPNAFGSVELFKFIGTNQVGSINRVTPSFNLAGQGWYHVEIHANEGAINALISNDKGTFGVANQRPYRPGIKINTRWMAWTGIKTDLYKWNWKNTEITVIRPDNCSGTTFLKEDEVRKDLLSTCGDVSDCSSAANHLKCISDELGLLEQQGLVLPTLADSLTQEYALHSVYCDGFNQCSVDIEKQKLEAFNAGRLAGAKETQNRCETQLSETKREAYDAGFAEGKSTEITEQELLCRGKLEETRKSSYDEGFSAGKLTCPVSGKASICHKGKSISVSTNALPAHYGHGDTLGSCVQVTKRQK